MTTLETIGFTVAGGAVMLATSMGLFGLAVRVRHPFIAPRATARPRDVIHNPRPKHKSQNRGNAFFGWIGWTLGLSYDTMLRGVPGTGTRGNGMSGSMLRVNLDGIVLLRFHALCLRLTALATVLLVLFILPLYLSAQCYRIDPEEALGQAECASTVYNLTNYEQTTIANVPSLSGSRFWSTIVHPDHSGVLLRLYAVVIVFLIMTGYLLHLLYQEWIHVLALRRVYYLEYDVWGERREELKQTLLFDEISKQKRKNMKRFTFSEPNEATEESRRKHFETAEKHLTVRDPWIPHPEQRDTVPNVSLYSVLVGGLPSLPDYAADTIDTEATISFSRRESMDWQLSLTSTFFDHCVPNQPGFSSSVAAVTIIPGAKDLSLAWKKWYQAAGKLRRLKFIRNQIAERRHYDIQVGDEEEGLAKNGRISSVRFSLSPGGQSADEEGDETPREIYAEEGKNHDYYREVLGSLVEQEVESHIFEAMHFGPEQTAVYSREFAQSAAPCCPNGCFEGRIRNASIDDLLEMERYAASQLHKANLELREARSRATRAHAEFPIEDAAELEPVGSVNPILPDSLPPSERSKLRRNVSLEKAKMPSDLHLESELYQKTAVSFGSADGKTRLRPKPIVAKAQPSSELKADYELRTKRKTTEREDGSPRNSKPPPMKSIHEVPNDSNVHPCRTDWKSPPHDLVDQMTFGHNELKGRTSAQVAPWEKVQSIVSEMRTSSSEGSGRNRHVRGNRMPSGVWEWPTFLSLFGQTKEKASTITTWAKKQSAAAIDDISRESTYAVITFTSRQAAVAARQCLADGRAADRWVSLASIPIPPLADAASCDLLVCRNCCRPVTLSINDRQKNVRNYAALAMLAAIYSLYTIPLTLASTLLDPSNLQEVFPILAEWSDRDKFGVTKLISGLLSALIWTTFFALCPIMFKSIANFGSKATSVAQAEFKALQYFWWFMVLTAFTGQLLAQMVLYGFNDGLQFGTEFTSILRAVALSIPSGISASWLNWIIVRCMIILPLNYLLQVNTFLFHYFGMPCCARVVRGGGPGGPTPYRIYVDSGVVLMCTLALAPASPLVAPACFFYFLFCQPVLRRNSLFMYRPKYDGGGLRFPFIFDMAISALVVGQVLLCTSMALKQALGPAILAAVPIVPTILFSRNTKKKFLRAYQDAALLQTSLLDGWNTAEETSEKERQEFRKFLVDAHKAAYVPVCIAGAEDEDSFLTAEPAVVVPLESELADAGALEFVEEALNATPSQSHESENSPAVQVQENRPKLDRRASQHGATLRRAVHTLSALRQRRDSSTGSENVSSSIADERLMTHSDDRIPPSEEMEVPSSIRRNRQQKFQEQQNKGD